jgi:multidrug efflux pump subunit AcrB
MRSLKLMLYLPSLNLPEGVSVLPSSASETNRQLQDSLKVLGGLAAFLVFVVMAVQYNSLIDPLVIMLTVPLALAGGYFWALCHQNCDRGNRVSGCSATGGDCCEQRHHHG